MADWLESDVTAMRNAPEDFPVITLTPSFVLGASTPIRSTVAT